MPPRPGSAIVHADRAAAVAEYLLTDTCDVQRNVESGTDPGGGPLPPDWETVHAGVACRYFPASGSIVEGDQVNVLVKPARLAFLPDADVRGRDRIANLADRDGTSLTGTLTIERPPAMHRGYLEVTVEGIA